MTTSASSMAATAERPLGFVWRIVLLVVVGAGALGALAGDFGLWLYLPYALVGAALVIRRPRNRIGWLLIVIAWCFDMTSPVIPLDPVSLAHGTAPAWTYALVLLGSTSGAICFWVFLLLMLIFPSGRMPTGRGRGLAILALVATGLCVILTAFQPTFSVTVDSAGTTVNVANPIALLPDLPIWGLFDAGLQYFVIFGFLIAGAVSMVVRWRRSSGLEAQQLRWMVVGLAAVTAGIVIGVAGAAILDDPNSPAWFVTLLVYPLPPLAVGVAILRYRLYEIDRIVSRTIGWALVTAVIGGAYVVAILGLGALFAPFAGNSSLVVVLSTLAIAAIFQPVRRRIQAVVDRRFNRARIDAERTAAAFASRLRDQVDLAAVTADLRSTISRAVEPSTSAIWLRRSARPG
jgi:hypothetical protein